MNGRNGKDCPVQPLGDERPTDIYTNHPDADGDQPIVGIDGLDLDKLKALQKDVNKAVEEYDERRKKEARAEVEAKARELGFSLSELADGTGKAGKKARTPQPANYRHPENASLTWSGRGHQPGWIKEALANGTSLDEFLIEPKSSS